MGKAFLKTNVTGLIEGRILMPTEDSVFSKEDIFDRLDTSYVNAKTALQNQNEELANFILQKLLNQILSLTNTTLLTPEEAVLFLRLLVTRIKTEKLKFLPDLISEIRTAAKV